MNQPRIPTHWSPEQALAVYEYLQQLSEQLWDYYHGPIIDLIGPGTDEIVRPHTLPTHLEQIELFESDETAAPDIDDDLPF